MRVYFHNGSPLPATIPTFTEFDPAIGSFEQHENPKQLWERAEGRLKRAEELVDEMISATNPNFEQMAFAIQTEARKAKQFVNGITETLNRVEVNGQILNGRQWLEMKKAQGRRMAERLAVVEAVAEVGFQGSKEATMQRVKSRTNRKLLDVSFYGEWMEESWHRIFFGSIPDLLKAANPFPEAKKYYDEFANKVDQHIEDLKKRLSDAAKEATPNFTGLKIAAGVAGGLATVVGAAYAYRAFAK